MKKTILFLMVLLFSFNYSFTQCTTGFTGSANTLYAGATKTGQTFKVACSGQLTSLVFTPQGSGIEDCRDSFAVGVRLRDASGAIIANATINGAATTDQWFNNATITANFSASNLTLTANTTYRWEVYETNNNSIQLFSRTSTDLYVNGNVIVDNTVVPASDAIGWTVNVAGSLSSTSFQKENSKVFPNPSKGLFSIENEAITKIEIFDLAGKMIWENENEINFKSVDLSSQPSGIYICKLTSNNSQIDFVKLIKN